jgi:hypothetical protein
MGATVALFRKPSGLVSIQGLPRGAGLSAADVSGRLTEEHRYNAGAHCAPGAAQGPVERFNDIRLGFTSPGKRPARSHPWPT